MTHFSSRAVLGVAAALLSLAPTVRAEDPPAAPKPAEPAKAGPGRLGFSLGLVDRIPPAARASLPEGATGVVVVEVVPGSPAEAAGLRVGDLMRSMRGRPVPTGDDFNAGLAAILEPVRVGDPVALEIERGAEKKTLTAVAAAADAIDRLRRRAAEGPSLSEAGAAAAFTEAFEAPVREGLPAPSGRWTIGPSSDAVTSGVLRQEATVDPWAVAFFPGSGRALVDGTVTVRFRPVSGREDASGGIVFRAQDPKNYYLVRANALEGNFRFYSVKDGNRWQIAGIVCDPPDLGKWHELSVTFRGKSLKAVLDGKAVLEGTDDLFLHAGWVGLWTKADSVTEFDDLVVTPSETSKTPPAPPPDAAPKTPPK